TPLLHSFPTRRSSDLRAKTRAARSGERAAANEKGSGAGGNRTPVPRQSAGRLYACVRWIDLGPEDGHRQSSPEPSFRKLLADTPGCAGCPPARCLSAHALSGVGREPCDPFIRPRERNCCWQLMVCMLFTRPACSSTRHVKPSLHGRNQIGPSCQRATKS